MKPGRTLVLLAAAWTAGCTKPEAPSAAGGKSSASRSTSVHDHDGHAHGDEHGQAHEDGHADEDGHAHEGPHGGVVAEWGAGTYHVELVVDHAARAATVYVFGSDESIPAAVAATDSSLLLSIDEPFFQVVLHAAPADGDTDGKASRFTGTHEDLGVVRELSGSIIAEVDGVPYAGDFSESQHESGPHLR